MPLWTTWKPPGASAAFRGYATEAAHELLRICFEELGLRRVIALHGYALLAEEWRRS